MINTLLKRYTEFRLCHAKRCIGKALNLTSQRPKHIAFKVTFCFASAGGNRIKYSGSFEFVPQRIKLTFVIFCIFFHPSNILQTFTLFSVRIKNVPCRHRATSLRGKRSKQFIFDMCGLIALSSPRATHTHTHTPERSRHMCFLAFARQKQSGRTYAAPETSSDRWLSSKVTCSGCERVISSCVRRNEMF